MVKLGKILGYGNKKVEESLGKIKTTLESIYNQLKELKVEKFSEFLEIEEEVYQVLNKVACNYNSRTTNGIAIVENLELKTNRLSDLLKNVEAKTDSFEIDRFYETFLSFTDHLALYQQDISNISYERGGITIMGDILALLPPPIGILSVFIGIVLILDKDIRARLNGIIMILLAGIVFGYNFILF